MGNGGSIPAIAVTAFTEVSRARVIEQGFSDHVSKPIDPAKLVASIRKALAAALRQERRKRMEGTGVA
jgi:CheY-like chemotaxis protein